MEHASEEPSRWLRPPAAVLGGSPRQAVEIIRSTMLTIGEQLDLHRAQDELAGEGGR